MIKKTLILFIFFVFSTVYASHRTEMAKESTLMQAQLTFNYLGDNLQLDIVSINEIGPFVEIQLAIGTNRRPARIESCFISTFKNNGFDYISNLEHKWDEPCH